MDSKNTESLRKSKLSLIGVIALIFSFVAAGCFGIEEAIAAAGPGVTIMMLIIFPFVWSFPLCEMVGDWVPSSPQRAVYTPGAGRPSASSGAGRWAFGPR